MSPVLKETDNIHVELLRPDINILTKYATNKNKLVELGTFFGGGSILFSKLAKQVITVDIFEKIELIENNYNREHYKILFDKEPRLFKDIKQKLSKYPNIKVVKNLTYKEAKKHKDIDMIFIDADHSYEGVKKDFNSWFPKIELNGIIAFHDSNPGNGWTGIPKFMEELKKDDRVKFLELQGSVSVFKKIKNE